jgi:predicted nucleic acid-binding protein
VFHACPAAFAKAGNMRLVTFDRGFEQFPALYVTLLS